MLPSPVNFEQLEVPLELFGKSAAYLQEDLRVKMQLYDGRPLSGSVPKQVTCSIKETQANMKGTTVTPRVTNRKNHWQTYFSMFSCSCSCRGTGYVGSVQLLV
ncbi:Elongation factor P [Linum perenne]